MIGFSNQLVTEIRKDHQGRDCAKARHGPCLAQSEMI